MNNRDAAKLGFRLLGLWFMANAALAVAGLPYYWDPRWEEVRAITVFAALLPALVAVGIGVPIWFSAEWFAARTFPEGGGDESGRLRGDALFALALSIIGVLFVCESLPILVNGLALFVQSRSFGTSVLGPNPDLQSRVWHAGAKANVASGVARLLIGGALIAGPAKLSRAVARVRKELSSDFSEAANR